MHEFMCNINACISTMAGSADDPVWEDNGASADIGMAKYPNGSIYTRGYTVDFSRAESRQYNIA